MPTITPLWRSAMSAVGFGFHVGQVLLELAAAHAVADDVEERQHARLASDR